MKIEVTVPRLGWSMEEGVFQGWLKREGEWVGRGDLLFVLEGDKAAQEVESLDEGVLRLPAAAPGEGDVVQVGQVLAYLEPRAVAVGTAPAPAPQMSPSLAPKLAAEIGPAGTGPQPARAGTAVSLPPVVPAATPIAAHPRDAVDSLPRPAVAPAATALPGARPVLAGSSGAAAAGRRPRTAPPSSPRARRIAASLGVDWARVAGGGPGGRVREQDVRASLATAAAAPPLEASPAGERVPLTALRRTIAARLTTAAAVPTATLTRRADATALTALRRSLASSTNQTGPVPGYTDLLVKLVGMLLPEFPYLNARWDGDALLLCAGVNIGIAVDTDAGLVVPVLRDVPSRSLGDIAAASRAAIERARANQLTPADCSGGTFTITNLGGLGVETFTPVLNPPQAAILGVGRITPEAVVHDGAVVAREGITLSLTFDHRVLDGAPAARFLDALRRAIENPERVLN